MKNLTKSAFLQETSRRLGKLSKLPGSLSLFRIAESDTWLYIRYSRVHDGDKTWYGLRNIDLQELEGHPSFICFLWDGQKEPLLIPFAEYEEIFHSTTPAEDGQYKAQVLLQEDGIELYIARAGRFNVEGYIGWNQLDTLASSSSARTIPDLSHSQIQTLLGSIGIAKDLDIWIPPVDRTRLDWNLTKHFDTRETLPYGFERVENSLQEVDVVWLQRGSNDIRALFEVEHSTPIYSGLLRFNDIHLVSPNLHSRFSIVANNTRRSLFAKQINRPTFQMSGLSDLCTFLEYTDVYNWHTRISAG